jgi:hypothetical protein
MLIRAIFQRLPIVAFGIAFTALLAACGGPPIALQGTITDAYTGATVPNATLQLGKSSSATDANGSFQFPSWSNKDTLTINAQGYESLSIALESQPQFAQAQPPSVTLDATIRPNTVTGTVINGYTNEPVAGADVRISDTISTTTGTDGSYVLGPVPESFSLKITASDFDSFEQSLSKTTTQDVSLRPNVLTGKVVDSYTEQAIAGATIEAGTASATTAEDGTYRLENVPADATVTISANGYAELTQPIEASSVIDAALRPDVLRSAVIDAETKQPIPNATIIATPNLKSTSVAMTRIRNQADGKFELEGIPEQGYIQVLAPGYLKSVIELTPGNVPESIELEPFQSKSLYITAAIASIGLDYVSEYFDLIDTTELNSIVIDLKSDLRDDLGLVYYDSQVPLVKELDLSANYVDMEAFLAEAKRRGIYTIARIQLFSHDNVLADARPEWGIQDLQEGGVYADYPGPNIRYAYLDPTNRNVWDYNLQLGVEAALMGFDEINYDYVRFPDWYGDKSTFNQRLGFSEPLDPVNDPDGMFDVITGFAKASHDAINGAGAYVSLDVFGRVMLNRSLTISQDPHEMADNTDFFCPMPYPSLWWAGYLDLDNPTAHPYEVILGTMENGHKFFETSYGKVRPWLQDHTDPWQGSRVVEYGPAEVRAQIKAVDDYGQASGWMLYDSANAYRGAFGGAVKPQP